MPLGVNLTARIVIYVVQMRPQKHKALLLERPTVSQPGESGIPGGVGIPLTQTQVRVCTQCGKAEFDVPELDMQRWFGKQPYHLGVGS